MRVLGYRVWGWAWRLQGLSCFVGSGIQDYHNPQLWSRDVFVHCRGVLGNLSTAKVKSGGLSH